jgi:predicted nucleotidyltransferase
MFFMTLLIEQNQEAIFDLCRKYGVARLEVFGSAASDTFDPERSDVDFLVDFTPGQDLGPWLKHYFEFKEALEKLLGRPVDLVMGKAVTAASPYFLREVNRTRKLIYETQVSEMAR